MDAKEAREKTQRAQERLRLSASRIVKEREEKEQREFEEWKRTHGPSQLEDLHQEIERTAAAGESSFGRRFSEHWRKETQYLADELCRLGYNAKATGSEYHDSDAGWDRYIWLSVSWEL